MGISLARAALAVSFLLSVARTTMSADAPTTIGQRLAHDFDFDERGEGNLEDIPKYWLPLKAPEFPRFAHGVFDFDTGHDAPPSFRLETQGRNVAYRFTAREIEAFPFNEYLVTGWIGGQDLEHARACISAYYLDADLRPIDGSQRFSPAVSALGDMGAWQSVDVVLPAGPADARWIGLTVWVYHPETWDTSPKPHRHIVKKNITATAWFDEIRVYRLPRVTVTTSGTGNVLTDDRPRNVLVDVSDTDHDGLISILTIHDMQGHEVLRENVPARHDETADVPRFDVTQLPNGLYRAKVEVSTKESGKTQRLAQRSLTFARIRAKRDEHDNPTRIFGLSLDVADRSDPLVELSLIQTLGVSTVKLPIWSGRADVPDLVNAPADTDTLLYELLKSRVAITGVFAGPPSELVRAAGAYERTLLSTLIEDPEAWREHLVRVFAPYASVFRSWQIGPDGDASLAADPKLEQAVKQVRAETKRLATSPHLIVPGSLAWTPTQRPPDVDDNTYSVEPFILPDQIESHIDDFAKAQQPVGMVYLKPAPDEGVRLDSRLRNWCKRLIHAAHSGVRNVVIPQPWHTSTHGERHVTEPTEEFVLLHTLADILRDTTPGDFVYIAPSVAAVAFYRDEEAVLAVWDTKAESDGRTYDLQLGPDVERVDMWGRKSTPEFARDGRVRLNINATPTYLTGLKRWLLAFRSAARIEPAFQEMSIEAHESDLTFGNPGENAISGRAHIRPPKGWDIRPRQFRFSIPANGQFVQPLEIRFGRNEIAGQKIINVEVDVESDGKYHMVIPLVVELGVGDLDAWGHAVLDKDRLIVQHRVFNRSHRTLNLRAYAIAPGRLRQTRIISNLLPGQSRVIEYHFKKPGELLDRSMRLQVRDLEGSMIHNTEVQAFGGS